MSEHTTAVASTDRPTGSAVIEVMGPRIIVKPVPPPQRASGLHLPATVREEERRAIVLAVGSRKGKHGEQLPLDVVPGQIVRYEHGGMVLEVDGEPLMFLPIDDIYAVEVPELPE
jgi:co-chaperonin GroES (HSP10)